MSKVLDKTGVGHPSIQDSLYFAKLRKKSLNTVYRSLCERARVKGFNSVLKGFIEHS